MRLPLLSSAPNHSLIHLKSIIPMPNLRDTSSCRWSTQAQPLPSCHPKLCVILKKPGTANYMKALADMAHALQNGELPPRIGYLVSATVNAIMAELVEQYYGTHLDQWQFVRENPTDPKARQIAYDFWTNEDVALLDTDHWLQVADSIAEKMERQS